MSRFVVLCLLTLGCLAASASVASATSATSPCVYKVSGKPVYMQIRGVLAASACDIVGRSSGGTVDRIFRSPVGQIRCAFAFSKVGLTTQMYSSSNVYGPLWCDLIGQKLTAAGWRKLF
jgi:hypothetical protein